MLLSIGITVMLIALVVAGAGFLFRYFDQYFLSDLSYWIGGVLFGMSALFLIGMFIFNKVYAVLGG